MFSFFRFVRPPSSARPYHHRLLYSHDRTIAAEVSRTQGFLQSITDRLESVALEKELHNKEVENIILQQDLSSLKTVQSHQLSSQEQTMEALKLENNSLKDFIKSLQIKNNYLTDHQDNCLNRAERAEQLAKLNEENLIKAKSSMGVLIEEIVRILFLKSLPILVYSISFDLLIYFVFYFYISIIID